MVYISLSCQQAFTVPKELWIANLKIGENCHDKVQYAHLGQRRSIWITYQWHRRSFRRVKPITWRLSEEASIKPDSSGFISRDRSRCVLRKMYIYLIQNDKNSDIADEISLAQRLSAQLQKGNCSMCGYPRPAISSANHSIQPVYQPTCVTLNGGVENLTVLFLQRCLY